jgi:DNA-binding CsgD family transcriptional regulator
VDFLDKLQQVLKRLEDIPIPGNEFVLEHELLSPFMQQSQFRDEVVLVQRIGEMTYRYASPNTAAILGYSADEIMAGGVALMLQLMDQDDARYFIRGMEDITSFLQSHKQHISSPIRLRANYKLLLHAHSSPTWFSQVSYSFAKEAHQLVDTVLITLKPLTASPTSTQRYELAHWINEEGWEELYVALPQYQKTDLPISKRELAILQEVSLGFSSREVAERLKLSRFTIDTHLKNIRAKLSCRTTAEAIAKMAKYFNPPPNSTNQTDMS